MGSKFFCCEVCARSRDCGNDCGSCDPQLEPLESLFTMKTEKTIVFDATVRDVFSLALDQIPNLRPLLDEMAKLTPANRRVYKALLHVVATEHNLRTAKTGEQQKLPLPESARPQVRTPSKAENWATFTREFSEEILRADKMNPEPWSVPTVIWRNGLLGLTVGVQTRDGEMNIFGSQMACKTQLLYLTQHRKNKGTWFEAKAALPPSRTEFWDEELLPLYGGGPVNQPDRPRDEYEDNQWILLRPTEVAHPMYFRTVVHATKLDQDLLDLSRYWRIDRLTLTSIEAHEYLVECSHYMAPDVLRDLANKLKLEIPKEETAR